MREGLLRGWGGDGVGTVSGKSLQGKYDIYLYDYSSRILSYHELEFTRVESSNSLLII